MTRPLPGYNTRTPKLITFLPGPIAFFVVLTVVFSVVTFLCGSHGGVGRSLRRKKGKKTVRLGGERKSVLEKTTSGLSSKALSVAKMVTWTKVQDEGEAEEDEDGDDVVWKKTIIKGERCRPIDFSGKILYDADGNLLPNN